MTDVLYATLGIVGFVSAVFGLAYWMFRFEKKAREQRQEARPEDFVEPIDESDTFCTCPGCGWLGNHAVESRPHPGWFSFPTESTSGHGQVDITMGRQVERKPGLYAHRTCWKCGHEWGTVSTISEVSS